MQAFLKGGSAAASKSKPDALATPLSTKKTKDGKTKIVPWIEK